MIPLPALPVIWTAIKGLFGNWKFYAVLVALAVLFVACLSTYKWIYNSAYQAGVDDTVKVYQPQIDKFNTEATVRNAKIADLQKELKAQAFNLITLTQKVQDLSLSNIDIFTKEFPVIAKECSVQKQTASAYNDFLAKALLAR